MATKKIAWNDGGGNITLTYTGRGNETILVQSDANNLDVARSQQITIETTNGSPVVTKTVTISQAAKPFTPVITDYTYTGSKQTVTLQPGTYKLECWGAQGGYSSGGKGGYAVGTIVISEATTAYIYVGGKGDYRASGASSGGFNGGGNAYSIGNYYSGSGGGASDIRLGTDSLSARVIVAGGGGGAGRYNSTEGWQAGGYGGGSSGGTGTTCDSSGAKAGQGGSQSSRGASYYGNNYNSTTYGTLAGLGVGGGAKSGVSEYRTVGGGGGYYGGGYSQRAGAGGGSGYVGNLSDAQNKAGNTSFPAPSGGNETGHSGNGYVRITRIS